MANKTYFCTVSGLALKNCGTGFSNGRLVIDDRGNIDHVILAMKCVNLNTAVITDEAGNVVNDGIKTIAVGMADFDSLTKKELREHYEAAEIPFENSWTKAELLNNLKKESKQDDSKKES